MDNLEKYLQNANKQNIYIPEKFTSTIKNSLKNKKKLKHYSISIKKVIAACSTLILLTGSGVFASFYFNIFDLSSFGKNNSGVNTAVENGYIQNIDMNYIKKDNLQYKAEYLLIDDKFFDIAIDFKFNEDISNYQGFHISNINIKDENNNLIYSEDGNFEGKNDLTTTMGWKIIEKNNNENSIKQLLFLDGKHFPKSKKLYITFTQVILYNVNNGKPITKKIDTNCNFVIDVDNLFYTRQITPYYLATKTYYPGVKIYNAELSNTGFTIYFNSSIINEKTKIKLIDDNNNEFNLINSYR